MKLAPSRMGRPMKKIVLFLTIIATLLCVASSAHALGPVFNFNITGTTYNNSNGAILNATVATVKVYNVTPGQGPSLVNAFNATSNNSGNFEVNITSNTDYGTFNDSFFTIVLQHNNSSAGWNDGAESKIDFVGKALPQFPIDMILMLNATNIKFYLEEAATLRFNVTNSSDGATQPAQGANVSFYYGLKDVALGYPIVDEFNTLQQTGTTFLTLYVPATRNYSMMVYPMDCRNTMVTAINITEPSTMFGPSPDVTFVINVSSSPQWIYGNVTMSTGVVDDDLDFNNLTIIPYLLESGNMVFSNSKMPYNMSQWVPAGDSQFMNETSGSYNLTLFVAANGTNYLLLAAARNSSATDCPVGPCFFNATYYGAYMNATFAAGDSAKEVNFTLYPLVGNVSNITLDFAGGSTSKVNVTLKQRTFQLINGTGTNTPSQAFVETEFDYSDYGMELSSFSWMTDVASTDSGQFLLPVLNTSVKKMQVFTQDFAPRKISFTQAQIWGSPANGGNGENLTVNPVNVSMYSFNPGAGGLKGALADVQIGIYTYNSTCNVPNPPGDCVRTAMANDEDFNPFSVVIGGGSLNFRMSQVSTGITVYYLNVDLLASGPPDAVFDDTHDQSARSETMSNAWNFGSKGPEIYELVIIGVPYSDGLIDDSKNVNFTIPRFYDDDWSATWSTGLGNNTSTLPTDYLAYNTTAYQWFINDSGFVCNTTDYNLTDNLCFINTTSNMIWFKIPHFSGIGPQTTYSSTALAANPVGAAVAGTAGGSGSGGTYESPVMLSGYWSEAIDSVTGMVVEEAALKLVKDDVLGIDMAVYDAEVGASSEERHTIKVKTVGSGYVTLIIMSDPIEVTIGISKPKYIDLNGDGVSDLKVTLNSVKKDIIDITIEKIEKGFQFAKGEEPVAKAPTAAIISEPVAKEAAKEAAPSEPGKTLSPLPAKGMAGWTYLLILLVAVVAGVAYWYTKKKQ